MTCVYKKYEIKTKIVQEQWLQLKMKFLLGYNMKIVIYWGRINLWWEDFSRWGNEQIFGRGGGTPPIPQWGKP